MLCIRVLADVGNIQFLVGDFIYDEAQNRAVSVHSSALIEALRHVDDAGPLADELQVGKSTRHSPNRNQEATMKLYNTPLSPNGKRARICAAELGLALEDAPIDFARGDARTPDYLALNPMGKVPTLVDGSVVVWESAAILFYLAAKNGPSALWPADVRAQADTLRWLFFCSCHLDPHYTTLLVERFIKPRRQLAGDEKLAAHAGETLGRFLAVVEQQLSAREFVTGSFGLADIALGCTIELSPSLQHDLSPYPQLRAWLARCQSRPTWR